ncbi:hypothetical protein BDV18DRAFT_147401 [Aspergillus unguis]
MTSLHSVIVCISGKHNLLGLSARSAADIHDDDITLGLSGFSVLAYYWQEIMVLTIFIGRMTSRLQDQICL